MLNANFLQKSKHSQKYKIENLFFVSFQSFFVRGRGQDITTTVTSVRREAQIFLAHLKRNACGFPLITN